MPITCVACGRIFPVEHARCPNCSASMINQQISDRDVMARELKELIANTWSPTLLRQYRFGAMLGALATVVTCIPTGITLRWYLLVVPIGALLGAAIAFRRYSSFGGMLVFGGGLILISIVIGNHQFFSWISFVIAGFFIGLMVSLKYYDY